MKNNITDYQGTEIFYPQRVYQIFTNKKQEFPEFSLKIPEKKELASQKKGVVLGDGCETGCNSVLGPMSFVGKSCIVYPNVYVANGIFPEGSIFKTSQDYKKFNLVSQLG